MTVSPPSAQARRRLARLRLAAQLLSSDPARHPADAVRWMLAMQAQDERGVKWSVGLRTSGATEADVDAAWIVQGERPGQRLREVARPGPTTRARCDATTFTRARRTESNHSTSSLSRPSRMGAPR